MFKNSSRRRLRSPHLGLFLDDAQGRYLAYELNLAEDLRELPLTGSSTASIRRSLARSVIVGKFQGHVHGDAANSATIERLKRDDVE